MENMNTTASLGAELLNEIGGFLADDRKLRKLLDFARKLKREDEKGTHDVKAPCRYTAEEMKKIVTERLEDCRQGKHVVTHEEAISRMKRWL